MLGSPASGMPVGQGGARVAQAARPARKVRRNRDEQILEAAIRVFSERGYSAASLQDVADAVGLLKGSLYHYIISKESLLYRIFQEAHEQAELLMTEVDDLNLAADGRLREYIRRLTLFYLQDRDRASLYFSEWRHLTGDHRATVMAQRRSFDAYLRGLLSQAKDAGLTRDDLDVKLAAFYLVAAVNGVLIWYRPTGELSPTRVATEVAELSCASVLSATSGSRRPRPRSGPALAG